MAINLREEFEKTIDLEKTYNWIIIRHKTPNKCICWRESANAPDPTCSNCEGGGWIFNEWLTKSKFFNATTFKPVSHLTNFNYAQTYHQNLVVYLKSSDQNRSIYLGDLLFNIECKRDGKVINPIRRLRKWQIVDVLDLQLDNNKSEFIKLFANPVVA